MKNKSTLTICIPAFNEGQNLQSLLTSLLKQKNLSYVLKAIIIASDGSTDNTSTVVGTFKNKKIILIQGKEQKGVAFRQNQLFETASSDIVVLLNADIIISDVYYIEKLIKPILTGQADMTSSRLVETTPRNFLEQTLKLSMDMKNTIFNQLHQGNNIYTCRGPARAFSKKLYKKIHFPSSIGEDAYSYLFAKYHRFRFKAVKNAHIFYTLPSTFADHQKQSLRFLKSQKNFIREFGKSFVEKEYFIPSQYVRNSLITFFILHPIHFVYYLMILVSMKIGIVFAKKQKEAWDIVDSSKKVAI